MKQGLKKTLMAVAVAVMAIKVMAMAPVIGDIPSPVVGNAENVTPAQGFVYPDAIDLTKYASDPDSTTQPSGIIWSYEIVGTAKYAINGMASMTGSDDPNAPGAKQIDNQVGSIGGVAEVDPDNNTKTITVRNVHLSPIPRTAAADQGSTGVLTNETQLVTLYASDGSAYTSKTLEFYTISNGSDALSGAIRCYTSKIDTGSTSDFVYSTMGGGVTASFSTTRGLCLTGPANAQPPANGGTGPASGEFFVAYGTIPLVANNVYHIRVGINGSNNAAGNTPMWDLTVNNVYYTPTGAYVHGRNLYGANYFFIDAQGGANAAFGNVEKRFDFWWCPPAISQTAWNSTSDVVIGTAPAVDNSPPFAPSLAADKDAYIEFRMLDDPAFLGSGVQWNGSLCLHSMSIDRFNISQMQTINPGGVAPYNQTTVTDGRTGTTGNTWIDASTTDLALLNPVFSGGALTINATGTGVTNILFGLVPGSPAAPSGFNYGDLAAIARYFPVMWDESSLFLVSAGITAPTANDQANPIDLMWIGADVIDNELINLAWVRNSQNKCAMPKFGETQPYKALFFSNHTSANLIGNPLARLRPRLMFTNTTGLGGGGSSPIKLSSWRVDKVAFGVMQ